MGYFLPFQATDFLQSGEEGQVVMKSCNVIKLDVATKNWKLVQPKDERLAVY